MILYSYWCHECEKECEAVFKMEDRKQFIPCPECGGMAERTIGSHVVRDEPSWLSSAVSNLQPDAKDVKKIESRTEFNRYLKENNIIQTG